MNSNRDDFPCNIIQALSSRLIQLPLVNDQRATKEIRLSIKWIQRKAFREVLSYLPKSFRNKKKSKKKRVAAPNLRKTRINLFLIARRPRFRALIAILNLVNLKRVNAKRQVALQAVAYPPMPLSLAPRRMRSPGIDLMSSPPSKGSRLSTTCSTICAPSRRRTQARSSGMLPWSTRRRCCGFSTRRNSNSKATKS